MNFADTLLLIVLLGWGAVFLWHLMQPIANALTNIGVSLHAQAELAKASAVLTVAARVKRHKPLLNDYELTQEVEEYLRFTKTPLPTAPLQSIIHFAVKTGLI